MKKVTHIYSSTDTIRQLSPQELQIGTQVLSTNMSLKPTESLLIITDPLMETREAAIWFEAGKTITPKTSMMVFSGMKQNAQEPPKKITEAMSEADVIFLQTTYSLTHTKARLQATHAGARIASLPTATSDIIFRTLNIDYQPIAELSIKMANLLTAAKTAHLTSSSGTNIVFDLTNRAGIDDTGFFTQHGDYGNLPAGEAFIAPLEGTSNGVYIIDGSFADIQLDSPITIQVNAGMATQITGGQAASTLNQLLTKLPETARNIAEFGIGTNSSANPRGLLIEAEKAHGTVHIAIGDNSTFGGEVETPFHSDGVILSPTLKLDNQIIIQDGKFQNL